MKKFPNGPTLPSGYVSSAHPATLSESVEYSNTLPENVRIRQGLETLMANWRRDPGAVAPVRETQDILEIARRLPPGHERAAAMMTFLRVLGARKSLSTFLEMLRDSLCRDDTEEQRHVRTILDDAMHAAYGWCGQTLLLESHSGISSGTFPPEQGLEAFTGCSTPEWGLAMHIWQPNPNARSFPSEVQSTSGTLIEPPHSHPFDFASIVVAGEMFQSTYQQASETQACASGERYPQPLIHVDGVWPPHNVQRAQRLMTVENRALLNEGDAYFMPCDVIHDVEVNEEQSKIRPTITLFLSAEFMVRPHVYVARSLLEYHEQHPDLRDIGSVLSPAVWTAKVDAVCQYLNGETDTLNLDEVVKHTDSYAFMHC